MRDKLLELAVAAGSVEVPEAGGHRMSASICIPESPAILGHARPGHKRTRNAMGGIASTNGPEDPSKDSQALKTSLIGVVGKEILTPSLHQPQPAVTAETCPPRRGVPAPRHQALRLQEPNPLVFAPPSSNAPRPPMPITTTRGVTSPAAALDTAPGAGHCGNLPTHHPLSAAAATGAPCHNWPGSVVGRWSSSCGMYPAARPPGFAPGAKHVASAGSTYAPPYCMFSFAPGMPYAAHPGTVAVCLPSSVIAHSSAAKRCVGNEVAARNRQRPIVQDAKVGAGEQAAIEEVAESNGPMLAADDANAAAATAAAAAAAAAGYLPGAAEQSPTRNHQSPSAAFYPIITMRTTLPQGARDEAHEAGGTAAGAAAPCTANLAIAHPAAAGRCFRRTTGGAPPDSDVVRGSMPPARSPVGGAPGADQQPRPLGNPVQQVPFRTDGECDNWICAARAAMRHLAGLDGWLKQTDPRGGGSSNIGLDVKFGGADLGKGVQLPVAGGGVPDTAAGCCQPNCSRCCGQVLVPQQHQIFCLRQAARSQAPMGLEAAATNAGVGIDAGVRADRIVGCFDGTIVFGGGSSSQLCTRSPGNNSMPGPTGLWVNKPSYPYPHPYSYPYLYPYRVPGQPIPAYCYGPGFLCNSAYRYRCDNFDYGYSGQSHNYVYANGSIMAQRNPCSYGNSREILQASGRLRRSLSHPPMLDAVHNRHLCQYGLLHPSTQQEQGDAAWIGARTGIAPLRRNATAPAASLALANSGLPSAPGSLPAVKGEAGKAMAVGNAEATAVTASAELKRTSRPGIAAAHASTLAGAAATDSKERKAGDEPVGVQPRCATSSVTDQTEQNRRQQQRSSQACVRNAFGAGIASIGAAAHDDGSGPPSLRTPAVAGPARPSSFEAPGPLNPTRHLYSAPPVLSPNPASRLPTAALGGESNAVRCSYPNGFVAAKYGGAAAAAVSPVTARAAPGGSIAAATDVHNTPPPAGAGQVLSRLVGMQSATRVEQQQQQPSEVFTGPVPRGASTGAEYAPKPTMATRRRSRDDMEQGDQGRGAAWGGLHPFHHEIARHGGTGGYPGDEVRSSERPNKRGPVDAMARLHGFCLKL
ncbi:hypothetical protein VaNZ11_013646 [Volvox africanus]|uniref:Uncharacterized protein n=1 Tax=Volvox africanus TaxID=51714 RepID=A0ABQ5SGV0_9CHLO|nr:hypothetical protein VaNZ11_013646 [Volvox africanus]